MNSNKTPKLDITGKIGPLFLDKQLSEWPMYSYNRPAYLLWNGFDDYGNPLPDGLYLCRLQSESKVKAVKLILAQ